MRTWTRPPWSSTRLTKLVCTVIARSRGRSADTPRISWLRTGTSGRSRFLPTSHRAIMFSDMRSLHCIRPTIRTVRRIIPNVSIWRLPARARMTSRPVRPGKACTRRMSPVFWRPFIRISITLSRDHHFTGRARQRRLRSRPSYLRRGRVPVSCLPRHSLTHQPTCLQALLLPGHLPQCRWQNPRAKRRLLLLHPMCRQGTFLPPWLRSTNPTRPSTHPKMHL